MPSEVRSLAFQERCRKIVSTIREVVAKIRSIQGHLWPSVIDDIGVLATIDWFCREFGNTHPGIHVEKQVDVAEDEVPSSAKIVIFRVMQEAMGNVAKHSRANRLHLFLVKRDHGVEFRVEDNGVGFDPEEMIVKRNPWGGLGLLSMKERTELSGGAFGVESIKGKGTVVRARWPI
jgi:signal transduction histidine kinase